MVDEIARVENVSPKLSFSKIVEKLEGVAFDYTSFFRALSNDNSSIQTKIDLPFLIGEPTFYNLLEADYKINISYQLPKSANFYIVLVKIGYLAEKIISGVTEGTCLLEQIHTKRIKDIHKQVNSMLEIIGRQIRVFCDQESSLEKNVNAKLTANRQKSNHDKRKEIQNQFMLFMAKNESLENHYTGLANLLIINAETKFKEYRENLYKENKQQNIENLLELRKEIDYLSCLYIVLKIMQFDTLPEPKVKPQNQLSQ